MEKKWIKIRRSHAHFGPDLKAPLQKQFWLTIMIAIIVILIVAVLLVGGFAVMRHPGLFGE
jgi:hypothetical protein